MPSSSPAPGPRAAVHFRSLGCPKNQLDTEIMLGALSLSDFAIAERLEDAEVAIVNTCAFIESAREESIQAILEVADLRESGRLRALLVTGCMPQRYGDALAKELPEVDAFIGTSQYPNVPEILGEVLAGRSRGIYVEARRTHLYDHRLAAPADRARPLGLRQDLRGLRPHLQLLRDPGDPRQVPEPHARLAGRSNARRWPPPG